MIKKEPGISNAVSSWLEKPSQQVNQPKSENSRPPLKQKAENIQTDPVPSKGADAKNQLLSQFMMITGNSANNAPQVKKEPGSYAPNESSPKSSSTIMHPAKHKIGKPIHTERIANSNKPKTTENSAAIVASAIQDSTQSNSPLAKFKIEEGAANKSVITNTPVHNKQETKSVNKSVVKSTEKPSNKVHNKLATKSVTNPPQNPGKYEKLIKRLNEKEDEENPDYYEEVFTHAEWKKECIDLAKCDMTEWIDKGQELLKEQQAIMSRMVLARIKLSHRFQVVTNIINERAELLAKQGNLMDAKLKKVQVLGKEILELL